MNTKRKAARRLERDAVINLSKRRLWYADEPLATSAPTPQAPAPEAEKSSGAVDSGVDEEKPKTFDESYVKELRAENANWRKQTRELENRLKALEGEQNQKHEAELKEQAKWQELAEKREAKLREIETAHANELLKIQRQVVAARYTDRLPKSDDPENDAVAIFASRLQGSTLEELQQDAEKLIAVFGIQPVTQQPAPNAQARSQNTTTAAPGGQPVGRTDATRKGEYFGGANTSPIFQGGGVVINGNQD